MKLELGTILPPERIWLWIRGPKLRTSYSWRWWWNFSGRRGGFNDGDSHQAPANNISNPKSAKLLMGWKSNFSFVSNLNQYRPASRYDSLWNYRGKMESERYFGLLNECNILVQLIPYTNSRLSLIPVYIHMHWVKSVYIVIKFIYFFVLSCLKNQTF